MANRYLFIIILACAHHSSTFSQQLNTPAGASAAGAGYCSTTSGGIWGIFNNQAATASIKGLHAGVGMENRFLIKELKRVYTGIGHSLKKGCLFAGVDHFGGPLYSEMKVGAGYALKLGRYVDAGIKADMLRMHIGEGFGSWYAFTFEGGMIISFPNTLTIGIHCFNPLHVKWIGTAEHIAAGLQAGVSYRPEKSIILRGEFIKSTQYTAGIALGCEYHYRDRIFFRAGFKSNPSIITFGAGLKFGRLILDIASGLHAYLGVSPTISITYTHTK